MKKMDLGKDNLWKIVIILALPAMLGQLVSVLYGIIDRIYIGNINEIGQVALAGIGVCTPITTLITSFSFLVGVGGAPLLAIKLGEQNKDKAKQIMSNCLIMLIVVSLIVTIITFFSLEPLLKLFGATDTNIVYAKEYLYIYLIGAPFAIISLGLNQFISCQGFSTAAMKTMLIGAILNIILDPLFIFVFKMNVTGAALATIISQICSFLYTIYFLTSKKTIIKLSFGNYDFKLMRTIIMMGLSPFIILATDSLVQISLNVSLSINTGSDADFYLSVATIAICFYQLITMPLLGISGGTQAVLSYNYGARNTDRVKKAEKIILICGFIFTVSCSVLSIFVARPFTYLFTKDPKTIDTTVTCILIFVAGIIPLTIQYCLVDGMTALAQPKAAALASLIRKAIVISLTWILPIYIGYKGVFYAEMISDILGPMEVLVIFSFVFPKLLKNKELEKEMLKEV